MVCFEAVNSVCAVTSLTALTSVCILFRVLFLVTECEISATGFFLPDYIRMCGLLNILPHPCLVPAKAEEASAAGEGEGEGAIHTVFVFLIHVTLHH